MWGKMNKQTKYTSQNETHQTLFGKGEEGEGQEYN
jgi:hypothetical protein